MMWDWIHMHIQLHFIVQNLNKLLHGWKVTRFQLRPHWYIVEGYLKCACRHALVLNHVAQEEHHHARIDLIFLAPLPDARSLHAKESKRVLANNY